MYFQTTFGKIFDFNAEFIERFQHTVGIVGFEQGMDFASVVGQGGEQQGAVADAFGTGQGDGGGFERGGREADGFGHDGRLGSGNRKRHYTAGRGRLKNVAAAIR